MAKKICLGILLTFALPNFFFAQEIANPSVVNKTLIVQATISPGFMFQKPKMQNTYFHATLEWGFDDHISIRADGSYFFTTQGDYKPLKMNHSLLLGAYYHFPKNNRDFYVGIQPGAACVKQNPYTYLDSTIANPRLKVTPIMTVAVGFNYFFWKYMNLFVAVKFVHGSHISDYGNALPLDELRISAGLGWQIQFNKRDVKKG